MKHIDSVPHLSEKIFVSALLNHKKRGKVVTRVRTDLYNALEQDKVMMKVFTPDARYRAAVHILCRSIGRNTKKDVSNTKIMCTEHKCELVIKSDTHYEMYLFTQERSWDYDDRCRHKKSGYSCIECYTGYFKCPKQSGACNIRYHTTVEYVNVYPTSYSEFIRYTKHQQIELKRREQALKRQQMYTFLLCWKNTPVMSDIPLDVIKLILN